MSKRQYYTKEFKEEAVKLVLEEGYQVTEAARSLGINVNLLSKWKKDQEEKETKSQSERNLELENRKLRKENKRLIMEREILKKAAAFFAKESE